MLGSSSKTATTAPFRVRPARRGDAEAIRSLLAELGYQDAADGNTVHWIISHPEMEIFVAADSHDKPIGVISLSHRPQLRLRGRIATIDELVVTASWRRRGVGRELLRHAIDRARVLSVRRLELLNHGGLNDPVRAFFERCGFKSADVLVYRFASIEAKS